MSFICMRMKNHFHIKGWAPNFVLMQRPGRTKKWPIRPLQDQTYFRTAWRLRTNNKCFSKVSMIIFLDILKTDSVRHAGEVLKITKCPRSTIESTSNKGQCLKSLEMSKEAFYVFIRIKSENSWKWNGFKTVLYLPLSKHFAAAWSLSQNTESKVVMRASLSSIFFLVFLTMQL